MMDIHGHSQDKGPFKRFPGRARADHKAFAREHRDPEVTKERRGLSSYFRATNRMSITELSISDPGDRYAGGPEVNGRGLTHGIGFVNGLGFTKQSTSDAKGELSKLPYYTQTGMSNEKSPGNSSGLQFDTALINGLAMAKGGMVEPPKGRLNRKKRKKRLAFEALQKKSAVSVSEIVDHARSVAGWHGMDAEVEGR
jgi:hypothetical protein